jgi:hypothetical protein
VKKFNFEKNDFKVWNFITYTGQKRCSQNAASTKRREYITPRYKNIALIMKSGKQSLDVEDYPDYA